MVLLIWQQPHWNSHHQQPLSEIDLSANVLSSWECYVKGIGKIKHHEIKLLLVIEAPCQVFNGVYLLRLTAVFVPEAMFVTEAIRMSSTSPDSIFKLTTWTIPDHDYYYSQHIGSEHSSRLCVTTHDNKIINRAGGREIVNSSTSVPSCGWPKTSAKASSPSNLTTELAIGCCCAHALRPTSRQGTSILTKMVYPVQPSNK